MIGTPQELMNWLYSQDREKRFEVKEWKAKRSLEANRFAWALIGQIADAMRMSKDDVYLTMLEHYGQSEIVSVVSDINVAGFFRYYKPIGTGTVQGKEFTHYRIFKGSSEFDTREMSIFLDGIIQEAENLGIPTMTQEEVERMKGAWNPRAGRY